MGVFMISEREYVSLSASRIADLVSSHELSAKEVVEAALQRVWNVDGTVRAFANTWPGDARKAAVELDHRLSSGERFALAGVPIGVKASERISSHQARQLSAAGCIVIGSTSIPHKGTPWQTWGDTRHGPTTNPWRADLSPGGSSAGSAAAVAAGIVPLSTGVDGAGSIRIPAAWCGTFGIKITNGRLPSRDAAGLTAIGPITRTVTDAREHLKAVLGEDYASTATGRHRSPTTPIAALWSSTLGFTDTDPSVAAIAHSAAERLSDAGIIEWRHLETSLLDPEPSWFSLRSPKADNSDAKAVQTENNRRLEHLFKNAEIILTPTTPGRPHGHSGPGDRMNTSLTWAFNLSGHPAATTPAGYTDDGCPVGLQLVARHHDENTLLKAAESMEKLDPQHPHVVKSFQQDR